MSFIPSACCQTESRLVKLEVIKKVQKNARNASQCATTKTIEQYFDVSRLIDQSFGLPMML